MNEHHGPAVPGYAYLSFAKEDAGQASRLRDILQAADVAVWSDTSQLLPGADWKLGITRAIKTESLAFIACFSDNSSRSGPSFQNEELNLAAEQMRLRPPGTVWLLPVRFTDCDIPPFDIGAGRTLEQLQRIDLFGGNWEHGSARLLAAVIYILSSGQETGPDPAASISQARNPHAERRRSDAQPAGTARDSTPDSQLSLSQAHHEIQDLIDVGLSLAATPIRQLDEIPGTPLYEPSSGPAAPGPESQAELAAMHRQVLRWRDNNHAWLNSHLGSEAAAEYHQAARPERARHSDPASELILMVSDLESEISALQSIRDRLPHRLASRPGAISVSADGYHGEESRNRASTADQTPGQRQRRRHRHAADDDPGGTTY